MPLKKLIFGRNAIKSEPNAYVAIASPAAKVRALYPQRGQKAAMLPASWAAITQLTTMPFSMTGGSGAIQRLLHLRRFIPTGVGNTPPVSPADV